MQKSLRSLALVAALALTAAPAIHAERAGCNPHPQVVTVPASSAISLLVYTVLSVATF